MASHSSSPPDHKSELAVLSRAAPSGVITVPAAAAALHLPSRDAALRLGALSRAGWLTRVKRGVYFVLPLQSASEETTTPEDPWTMAVVLYAPCYIGGWSAAEYWGLTEQLFGSTFVATAAHIRKRHEEYLGARFTLVRVKPDRVNGLAQVWRGTQRVPVSSRERTLVDAAIDPRWVGGMRHLADIFAAYVQDPSASADKLVVELDSWGSGSAAKRLGYLAEGLWPDASTFIDAALAARSTGIIKLDPAVRRRGSLNTRWGLWMNLSLPSVSHARGQST